MSETECQINMAKTLIIDGSNLYNRAYWACKRSAQGPNFIFVFLRMLHSYAALFKPDNIIMCWDLRESGEANKRKEMLEEYKAQRPDQKDIYTDFPELKEITELLGIAHIFPKSFEADDIIWYLATQKYPNKSIVITRDTDLYQLVGSKYGVQFYEPNKKIMIDTQYLKDNFEVNNGEEFIIKKALKGDSADNIKGISRIQKGRIQKIIDWLKENDIDSCPDLNDDEKDIFKRNLDLMKLDKILNIPEEIEHYKKQLGQIPELNKEKFKEICNKMKFFSILKNFNSWLEPFEKKFDILTLFDLA